MVVGGVLLGSGDDDALMDVLTDYFDDNTQENEGTITVQV